MVQAGSHDNERRQAELNLARQNGAKSEMEYHQEMSMLKREAENQREMMRRITTALLALQQNPNAFAPGALQNPEPGHT